VFHGLRLPVLAECVKLFLSLRCAIFGGYGTSNRLTKTIFRGILERFLGAISPEKLIFAENMTTGEDIKDGVKGIELNNPYPETVDCKENDSKSLIEPPVRPHPDVVPKLTKEVTEKVCEYIRKGLTWEKAGEIMGISPNTLRCWTQRHASFASAIKKARRELEVNLLESINNAGEKSWQAKAWMLERSFGYVQAPNRVEVKQDIQHGLSPALAQLLAGYNSKNAQIGDRKEVRQIEAEVVEVKDINSSDYNNHCATNDPAKVLDVEKVSRKRHKPMRRKRLTRGHDTHPASPHPADNNVNTP